jgi:formiminoglutamate deiminase
VTSYWVESAVLDGAVVPGVRILEADGVITGVTRRTRPGAGDVVLSGLALPGFANAHSHAFHRALRGRTNDNGGDFWSWREVMYRVAARLDLDRYERLATAAFAEMVLAGYTAVGEFHYVHHRPDGTPYADANAMAHALIRAAERAGIRLTLLDVIYQRGGLDAEGRPIALSPEQRRFSDGSLQRWVDRHAQLSGGPRTRIGAAVHSVRAVDVRELRVIAGALRGAPLHAHVSEQPAENAQSIAAYGLTPVAALAECDLLGAGFTAVHATHLTESDIGMLARTGSAVCFCPTTERDLADGIGQARALADAGVSIAIGSDQHAVVDPFEELRALEGHERLASGQRGRFSPADLLAMGTAHGYASLGWTGGRIAVGQVCDFVAVRTATARTAGSRPEELWLAAGAGDVSDTVVAGRHVVRDGAHILGDIGSMLADSIGEVFA